MLTCLEGHGGVVDVQLSNGVDSDPVNKVSYSYMFLCMCIVYRTTMSTVTFYTPVTRTSYILYVLGVRTGIDLHVCV